MEEEIAFMIDAMKISYRDAIEIPYSRRKRLIERKQDLIKQRNAEVAAENNRIKTASRRRR
jgi:hypothetical protein